MGHEIYTVGEIDKMKNSINLKLESHWHANFKRLFANFVAGFRTTFVRVSHKYLENFHVSRTSRELVAKFLNRFKKFMQMFSSKYFARLSRDCRNNENENKPNLRESRETPSRMSCDCRATVARQSRGIFSKLDRNSRICRINVHSMRMQRKSCVCLIVNLCREIHCSRELFAN